MPPTNTVSVIKCHCITLCYAKSLQSCPTLQPHRRQPTRLPRPWDSPGKNTGVGYHFLLQCMKVKSESEVTQSCPTLSDPMDCSLTGSSVHGIFQARVLEWGAIAITPQILIFNSMYEKYHCINFFWLHPKACRTFPISDPIHAPAVEAQSLNHWTTQKVHHCSN